MCDESSDILITYNPECVDRYSDSSDFDDETLKRRGTNHSILRRKVYRHSKMGSYERELGSKRYKNKQRTEIGKDRSLHPQHCTCKECTIPVEEISIYDKKQKNKYYNGDNNQGIRTTQSKLSMVRSKIIPCLSNIFNRSHSLKRDDITKNRHIIVNSTKDNSCQVYCVDCNHKRIRRPNKKFHSFGQSTCSTDHGLENSPDSGINLDSHHKHTTMKDSNISCDFTSSSISENLQSAKNKFKKMIEREIRKSYLKKQLRHAHEKKFPSRPNFQVFSAHKSNTLSKQELREMCSFGCNVMPSNSSVFWEYIVDKINKKYQNNNRGGMIKSCHCRNTQQCPTMDALLNDETGPKLDCGTTPACDQNAQNTTTDYICNMSPINRSPISSQPKMNPSPKQPSPNAGNVQCHCHLPTSTTGMPGSSMPQTPVPGEAGSENINKPCQEPHDKIKMALEKKYNGEILCIHNPPCILINGCLNLPPVQGQFSPTAAWPVTRSSFHCGFHQEEVQVNIQKQEQASQYQQPGPPLLNRPVLEYKTEKMTQSICNHDPPCEVVRCCYKPVYDPKLDNSCEHVPMCQKLPECVINASDNLIRCEHVPKCEEQPLCKKKPQKYIVLTAGDSISTQVKPNIKMECRHDPPCIMIPKCLGKLMCEGYVPCEAIPDCVHRPSCELIPACCRKSAKMVSVSCQYPASYCRIV